MQAQPKKNKGSSKIIDQYEEKERKKKTYVIWDTFIISQEPSSKNLRLQRRESISLALIGIVVSAHT
jgi:secreted PhoX family phosphatase